MNATPTPGDLSARHLAQLRDLRAFSANESYKPSLDWAIAALSALPAAGGELVGELLGYGRISGDAQVRIKKGLPPGTKLYTTPQPSAADTISTLVRLARHADDCLYVTPLPTGEGFWHCTCGYDSIILDGELYPMPRNLLAAPAAGKGVDDAMVEILRATTKQIGDALKEHRDNDPFVMVNPVSLIGWSGALSKVAAALTRQPVAGDGAVPDEVIRQQESLYNPATQVFFRAGLIACREYMARFVQVESPSIAASIRANWWPQLGPDFGPPRQIEWGELTDGEFGTDTFSVKPANEVSPTLEALPIAFHFLGAAAPAATPTDGGEGKNA